MWRDCHAFHVLLCTRFCPLNVLPYASHYHLYAVSQQPSAGLPLTGVGCIVSLVASILGAVAGCKIGPLPGIGAGTCCCPATSPGTVLVPVGAAAAHTSTVEMVAKSANV